MQHCKHDWVSNSGNGLIAVFRDAPMMSSVPIMHVKCAKCADRTWFTEAQWEDFKPRKRKGGRL